LAQSETSKSCKVVRETITQQQQTSDLNEVILHVPKTYSETFPTCFGQK